MKARLFCGALLVGATIAPAASAITREEALVRARAYATHRWSSGPANQTASCSAAYKSLFPTGDYVGVPYDWGGYMSLFTFDQQIAQGYGAGSQESDGILACTSGVDCSGYVSMVWATGHNTTSSIPSITSSVASNALLPGDVFNMAGFHVAMFTHWLQSGAPALIEAVGYNVHPNTFGGWSYVNGYQPRRFPELTGTTAGNPVGTTSNPIVIGSLPYTDTRDTRSSLSRVLDACGAAPAIQERGPEYVYKIEITQPGTLNISVQDDAATDIDVQLLTNLSTSACVARHDSSLASQVGCGTYWIVADTFGSGTTNAGPYTLNVSLTPSGQPCSAVAGPPKFDPKGKLGDACAYPGNPNLPFCNPNLGAETCIYGSGSSFCSKACAGDNECADMPGGGCCMDLGKGETYCMTKSFCSGGGSSGASGGSSGDDGDPNGGSSGGGAGGEDGDELTGDGTTTKTVTTGGCASAPSDRTPWELTLLAGAAVVLLRKRRRELNAGS